MKVSRRAFLGVSTLGVGALTLESHVGQPCDKDALQSTVCVYGTLLHGKDRKSRREFSELLDAQLLNLKHCVTRQMEEEMARRGASWR